MFWFKFRRTSPWAGGVVKAFFYNRPYPAENELPPGVDEAIHSWTRPQLEAFVTAAKAALAAWPLDV